jgi:argininosuccinate lyase
VVVNWPLCAGGSWLLSGHKLGARLWVGSNPSSSNVADALTALAAGCEGVLMLARIIRTRFAGSFRPTCPRRRHAMSSNPLANKQQAWSALFNEPMSALVQRYTSSVRFDQRLWQADIAGSLAHAEMLAAEGVIAAQDLADIQRGLAQISSEIEAGSFDWKLELEDVHLNIEARLTTLVGDAGKRLHTGRSRNDQVATDVRLWLRGEIDQLALLLRGMQRALVSLAAEHSQTVMPGYTHMQVAQPVSFAHHLLAYVEMFARDEERMADVRRRTNQLPLGAAALAGTSYPLDRERVARTLGFEGVCQNSLDAVSDRDFALEFSAAASICMVHISRLAEEIVLWMSQNFGFIDLADRYCTGSSIMPQKRNPDVAELARGKSGRVIGHLMGLLTLMKGQPLTYNKDNQEDKEPLFDTVDTLADTLRIMAEMVGGIRVKAEAMEAAAMRGYATATDLADYLVKKGLPFRDAHETVAHAVKLAIAQGVDLAALPLATLQGLNAQIGDDVAEVLSLRGSLNARKVLGGTAPQQVLAQVARHQARLRDA